jgi:hypothetical protein
MSRPDIARSGSKKKQVRASNTQESWSRIVTPRSIPQGRWEACAGVTTTRAPKSGMSIRTAPLHFLHRALTRPLRPIQQEILSFNEVATDFARPFPLDWASLAWLPNNADDVPKFKTRLIDNLCRREMSSNVASRKLKLISP